MLDPFIPGRVFCVGAAGSGVRAMAELLHGFGWTVAGTDRGKPDVLARMRANGMAVTHDPAGRGWDGSRDGRPDLLLHSPAVPPPDPARVQAEREGAPQATHIDLLVELTRRRETIAVAGTHGKSSTAALLVHLLRSAGKRVAGFVGAEPVDPTYSFAHPDPELLVVEACEWNRHFLRLSPTHAIITGVEFDHPDSYRDAAAVEAAFHQFVGCLPATGVVLRPRSGERTEDLAVRAAAALGVTEDEIRAAVPDAPALRRRFEPLGDWRGRLIVDDFAHHPAGLTWCRERVQQMGWRDTLVFQPHQIARTRAMFRDFVTAVGSWGRAAVLPVYPAREAATRAACHALSEELASAAQADYLPDLDALIGWADDSTRPGDALVLAGAGDIDRARDLLFPGDRSPGAS